MFIVYAHEVTIKANGKAILIKAIERLDKKARELGFEINECKTKYKGQAKEAYTYRNHKYEPEPQNSDKTSEVRYGDNCDKQKTKGRFKKFKEK